MSVPLRLVSVQRLFSLLIAFFLLPLPRLGALPPPPTSGLPAVAQVTVRQPSVHGASPAYAPVAIPPLRGAPPTGFVPAALRATQSPAPATTAAPIARPLSHLATTSTVGKIIVSGDEWPLTNEGFDKAPDTA